jgi:hypothetical protein
MFKTDCSSSTTSSKSSIPQSSTVTILDARSSESADAALSSFLTNLVMVVTATPAAIAKEFMVMDFSPASETNDGACPQKPVHLSVEGSMHHDV